MNKLLLVTAVGLFISNAYSGIDHVQINVRNSKMKMETKEFDVSSLSGSTIAETENFKVLNSTNDEAIDLTDERLTPDDRLRAGTVLHHLKIARNYFVNVLGSDHVESLPQINVRLQMTQPFNEYYRFIKDSKIEQYNNAVTVPASNAKAASDASPWNMEIWFRPAKNKDIDNAVFEAAKQIDSMDVSGTVVSTVADQGLKDAIVQQALYDSLSSMDYMGYVSKLLVTIGVFEVAPKILMFVSRPLKTSTFLDTAMIPEVTYHEFAHVALSDHVSLRQSSPLNEGLANYFAAVINNNSKIAIKNGDHSKNISGFNGKSGMKYDSKLETSNASHSNFVFSFLWGLRTRFGKDLKNGEVLADKVIFASRKHVTFADKSIKDDLIPSLVNAVEDVFTKTEARKIRLLINDEARFRGI